MLDGSLNEHQQCCPGCRQPLRAEGYFCPDCGCNLVTCEQPVASVERSSFNSRYESHLVELKRVGWLFGLLLFSSLVLGLFARSNGSPWPGTIASSIDGLIIVAFAGFVHREIYPLLRFPHLSGREWGRLMALAVTFVVLMTGYFGLIEDLGVPIHRVSAEYQKAGWNVGVMLLLVSVMPAVFEELAFRGVIQSTLEHVLNEREALLIQAALFSVLHLLPIVFPSHFLMGLCFGYMRNRSKSLYPGMALHAFWNAFVLLEELYKF